MRFLSALFVSVIIFQVTTVQCQSGQFFFLADWHIDPYYNPDLSSDTYCQNQTEIIFGNSAIPDSYYKQRDLSLEEIKEQANGLITPNYLFGQYGCDSPIALAQHS